MRIRSRSRRLALIAANVGNLIRFAGGVRPFATYKVKKLLAGEWRALIPWMTTAANFAQRGNPNRYRRWLKKQPPAPDPDGRVLILVSAVGIATDRVQGFLALVAAHQHADSDLIVLASPEQTALPALSAVAERESVRVVATQDETPRAMVDALGERLEAHSSTGAECPWRYVAFLAPGCVPGALPLRAIEGNVLIYGDEDAIDDGGRRDRPFFKPGYSVDLLTHADYLSSCLATTVAAARAIPDAEIGDFHSFALLLAERADEVRHVDAFLAHRYASPMPGAGPDYLQPFLQARYGSRATVSRAAGRWTCRYGNDRKFVSVVIPTKDRVDLLRPCIDGVYATNEPGTFEVVLLDNGSEEPETREWLDRAQSRLRDFRVVPAPGTFNWSWLNNVGIENARGDVLVFLNNDTEPTHDGWLARLADVAMRPDVGVVGALLLYPNGRIQHAGVVTGFSGLAAHVYCGVDPASEGHLFVPPTVPRNVAAVTGACLAVARNRVDAFGTFDTAYRISGGDVEFCIRAIRAGFVNVYLPDVRLIHHESQTRKREDPETDVARLRRLIAERFPRDPYYHPALSLTSLYPSYGP